ncbi:hypothetical protein DH2020_038722 [Rehmannia glutinosa]|uniref:Retrovirus-related Pol polyprotein from transposon RE1 n=1 Tax=Rehmannia glutinosa TaxID=99300 RepID=A0ABR0UXR5_REHGL
MALPTPTDTNNPSQNLIAINTLSQTPIKLTQHNFSAWRLQLYTLLVGYDLLGYVDGTISCPPATITSTTGTTTSNPSYIHWIRQDHLILNAIVSSLSPTIISFVATATTSKEAWNSLHNTFAKASRGRIIHYRTQLDNLSKGTQTITEYMQSVKVCVDTLSLMNVNIDPEELIIQIFRGLPDEYKDLHSAIRARETCVSFEELYEKLLSLEAQMNSETVKYSTRNDSQPASVNIATKPTPPNRPHNSYNRPQNQNIYNEEKSELNSE